MTEVAHNLFGAQLARAQDVRELFVINLCTSMTPMPEVPKHLKGFEQHKLYQIAKVEDGRRRYRLRLGFFHNETDAELHVASLRSMYPAALVSRAAGEDLKQVADIATLTNSANNSANNLANNPGTKPVTESGIHPAAAKTAPAMAAANQAKPIPAAASLPATAQPARREQSATPTVTPTPAPVAPKASPASKPTVPTAAASTVAQRTAPAAALSLEEPPLAQAAPTTASDAADDTRIFHVGRGINIPDSGLQLSADEPARPAVANNPPTISATPKPTPAAAAPATSNRPNTHTVAKSSVTASKPTPTTAATALAAAKPAQPIVSTSIQTPVAKPGDDYIPILDTTLTIRTLTKSEADDPNRPKWFVVQLASSELPIDISTMPKLDIFAAYQLYCVALMEEGSIRHTLRLGFFKERVSADAVMGYLKTFFSSPGVMQVSTAEYDRFSESKSRLPSVPASAKAVTTPGAANAASAAIKVTNPANTKPATASEPRPMRTSAPAPRAVSLGAESRNDSAKSPSFLSRLIGKQLD